MKSAKDELEECFNAIPKNGSNIKEADEDDDNGYSIITSDISLTFEDKAAQVDATVQKSAQVKALPRSTPQPTEPKAELKREPVPAAAVRSTPTTATALETILIETVKEVNAEVPRSLPTVHPEYDELEVDPSCTPSVLVSKQPTLNLPVEHNVAPVIPPKTVETPLEKSPINVDKNPVDTTNNATEELAAHFDFSGWLLISPESKFDMFYDLKKHQLTQMLSEGRLPIRKWRKELQEAHANVECSYDVNSMYEQMKFIQGLKVRVTEIITQLNSQYYKWKRFMELMRAEAAALVDLKVALSDAAALRHLQDFENYFCELDELNESAEGVMRNLESGWNTLNRGVTVVLQAQGADRGMNRYENTGAAQPSQKPNTSQIMARAAMQAFDTDGATNETSKIPADDPWRKVK
jgi:hypothetical protein